MKKFHQSLTGHSGGQPNICKAPDILQGIRGRFTLKG